MEGMPDASDLDSVECFHFAVLELMFFLVPKGQPVSAFKYGIIVYPLA